MPMAAIHFLQYDNKYHRDTVVILHHALGTSKQQQTNLLVLLALWIFYNHHPSSAIGKGLKSVAPINFLWYDNQYSRDAVVILHRALI